MHSHRVSFAALDFPLRLSEFSNLRIFHLSIHTISGVTDSNFNPFAFPKTGKKPGARERVCKPGVPKERYITILEVSSKRTRALGSSPHHHVETQSGRKGPGDTTSARYSRNFQLQIIYAKVNT